ncbi:hypothetical protein WH96_06365 [Kiloniella spongiae]|uniref:Uncharacterized protein n=1 Tax=Kiloniella spongiae TaxID=1489064 RepID=A0A0H2MIC9_9PROT|nr:hypothetical protein [Kiloniella spongiae]KLN61896.1 hypothetical protein WH96_06365 [Kiloniella spongiae]
MSDKWQLNKDGTATFFTDEYGPVTIDQDNFFDTARDDIIDIKKSDDDYHEYGFLYDLGISTKDVDHEVVSSALATFATPLGPKYGNFAGPGFVKHSSANPDVVTNYTTNLHLLDPGLVQRTIVVKDGNYHIRTVGIGTGYFKDQNVDYAKDVWGFADKRIKNWIESYQKSNSLRMVPSHKKIIGDKIEQSILNDRLSGVSNPDIAVSVESNDGKNSLSNPVLLIDPEDAIDNEVVLSERMQQGFNKSQIASPESEAEGNVHGFLNNFSNNELLRSKGM